VPKRNVVIVLDDDSSMLSGVKRILALHGFDSDLFDSAERFYTRARFDEALCLVLDIHLKGTTGIEVRRQLALSGNSLPVIFITGKDSERTRTQAMEAGCVAYLVKPFPSNLLVDAIATSSVGADWKSCHASGYNGS